MVRIISKIFNKTIEHAWFMCLCLFFFIIFASYGRLGVSISLTLHQDLKYYSLRSFFLVRAIINCFCSLNNIKFDVAAAVATTTTAATAIHAKWVLFDWLQVNDMWRFNIIAGYMRRALHSHWRCSSMRYGTYHILSAIVPYVWLYLLDGEQCWTLNTQHHTKQITEKEETARTTINVIKTERESARA